MQKDTLSLALIAGAQVLVSKISGLCPAATRIIHTNTVCCGDV
jgi:hypothetical protein